MNCTPCDIAEKDRKSGLYSASCDRCKARAISNGLELWEAQRCGKITPGYRDALKKVFGERWKDGHQLVKDWLSPTKAPHELHK